MYGCFTYGQGFSYPTMTSGGRGIHDFVPTGWVILDSAYGDLNKDGLEDAAIILQRIDSVSIIRGDEDTVFTQPRILFIVFRDVANKQYKLIEQSNSFILKHDNTEMEEPYQELAIDNGVLEIGFHIFYNMGSWSIINATYKFRYQDNNFVLIGADNSTFNRATHDFEDYSYNFLTKKRSLTKGNDNNGTKKTTWKTLNISALKTLKTFAEPFSWEVEENVYL
jgi:hypothetical protein